MTVYAGAMSDINWSGHPLYGAPCFAHDLKATIAQQVCFKNSLSGETLSFSDFASFVWQEAERQFDECHEYISWEDLSVNEQCSLYLEQRAHQLESRDWYQVEEKDGPSLDEMISAAACVPTEEPACDSLKIER